jgi:hypothetical protein
LKENYIQCLSEVQNFFCALRIAVFVAPDDARFCSEEEE